MFRALHTSSSSHMLTGRRALLSRSSTLDISHNIAGKKRFFGSRSIGIIGLPNVGKSTLFNAVTETQRAEAENRPFCTIDPNIGIVNVPDERLDLLADAIQAKRKVNTQFKFIDIAGLIRGASKGAGLGNKFLSHIRSVNQMIHLVRCFEDDVISHVDRTVDPLRDIDTIEGELALADLDVLERRKQTLKKIRDKRQHDMEATFIDECESALLESRLVTDVLQQKLQASKGIWTSEIESFYKFTNKELNLLTSKKTMFVCNVSENEASTGNALTEKVIEKYKDDPDKQIVIISAEIESQCAMITDKEERQTLLEAYGLKQSGMTDLIHKSYALSNLIQFFTVGKEEARAWQIKTNTCAQDAATAIHTDIAKGFIKADVIPWDEYLKFDCDDQKARAAKKLRSEPKSYVVQDGDCIHFHHRTIK